jgi:hypothetical protein
MEEIVLQLKQIEYAPRYYVSDTGKVYSTVTGDVVRVNPTCREVGWYEQYSLHVDGERIQQSGHRLVAEAFIPNPENKPYVNHKNGIKNDNRVENLEWATASENNQHAIDTGLNPIKGEGNPQNKYSEETIHRVCKLLEQNRYSSLKIEEMTGVSFQVVSLIRTGKVWKDISSQYTLQRKNKKTLDESTVIQICEHINAGVPLKRISEIFDDYPVRYIRDIRDCKRYKKLARQYIQQRSTISPSGVDSSESKWEDS